jgi:hypothetical protein
MLLAFDFWQLCADYGNVASIVGLAITLVGFALTWFGIKRAAADARKGIAAAVNRIAYQTLAADIERVIRYIGGARSFGRGGLWHTALDKLNEATLAVRQLAGNPQLSPAEKSGVELAVQSLISVGRVVEKQKLRKDATPRFAEPTVAALDSVVEVLGRIQSRLGAVSKIPLKDLAADPRQLEVMKRPMLRWQYLVTDLQPPRLAHPGQRALHDPADPAQPAPVGRPRLRQVVLDPPLPQAPVVPRCAVLPVAVERLWLSPRPTAAAADRRDVVQQGHGLQRFVAVGSGDPHRQRRTPAVHEQVAFGPFFGPIGGVFAGQDPPKTARKLWLSTQQCSQSMPFSRPTRWSRLCKSFFQTPRFCQCRSRRQHETPDPQPISRGSSFQGMPLRSTKTIPVKQARSSTGGRPRLPGRARCRGSSGAIASQRSSETSGWAIVAPPCQEQLLLTL